VKSTHPDLIEEDDGQLEIKINQMNLEILNEIKQFLSK
jgi:hypothetical protein